MTWSIHKYQIILKALISLGNFTLVSLSLAIWPWFAKFANVSTRQSFQFYSTG